MGSVSWETEQAWERERILAGRPNKEGPDLQKAKVLIEGEEHGGQKGHFLDLMHNIICQWMCWEPLRKGARQR